MAFPDSEFDPQIFHVDPTPEWLHETFPGAKIILPADMGRTVNDRYREADYDLGVMLFVSGDCKPVTLVREATPITRAIDTIADRETDGLLPEGSSAQAIRSIGEGTFIEQWSGYIPPAPPTNDPAE